MSTDTALSARTPSARPPSARTPRNVRFGLWLAAMVTAYGVLTYWIFRPLHAQGFAQSLLGFLNGFDQILQAPGLWLAATVGVRSGHHSSPGAWFFRLVLNAIGYFLVGLALAGVWRWSGGASCARASRSVPTTQGPAISRRGVLLTGIKLLGGGALAGLGYALVGEPRWFQV